MSRIHTVTLSRRRFLQGSVGLIIGLQLPLKVRAQSGEASVMQGDGAAGQFSPNAFLRIAPDNTVTVLVKHIEFGQGPYTGLATLVAEELDADWSQMRAESAPSDPELYKNLAFGLQGTGGSTAIANSYQQMRQAGAAARAMLVAAAAEQWQVDAGEISVDKGVVKHTTSGQQTTFGELAEKAATMDVPTEPALKSREEFTLIGTDRPKLDTVAKSTGEARFTLDVYKDGMITTAILHPPQFGATVANVDDTAARQIAHVLDVKTIPQGVVVYGKNTFAAFKGLAALKVEWDTRQAETRSSAQLMETYAKAVKESGDEAENRGNVADQLAKGAKVLEAEYQFPFLAHAPMETLDAVIDLKEDSAEVWMGSQLQTTDHGAIAQVLELSLDKVKLNTTFAGGSFGRRAQPDANFAAEAAAVAKAYGKPVVVKHLWTRENDIRGGRYRPLTVHRLHGAVDREGNITAWDQTIATQSIVAGSPFEAMIQDGIDPTSVEGARGLPYAIPNLRVGLHTMKTGVPVLWWRSVGHTHTAYTTETFIDELLELADKDPVVGRLALLKDHPRDKAVLERVAEMASWSGPRKGDDRALGVAVHKSFDSYVAQIAEVSRHDQGYPKVHKVWCAVDCGVAVNPNIIRAQMEGGIGYGLSAALFDEITLGENGRVVQANFDTYRSLRINEMPAVEVSIIDSQADPTGVGEPGLPPIAPAVANAWRVLTGETLRRLPFVPVNV
jgi:isoquinoline 1-oxidoreductase beta subunit